MWSRMDTAPAIPVPPLDGDSLASVEGVGVSLGGHRVLTGVDLDVRAGEVLALVGPNGAGKSTLLSAIAADLPCDEGTIYIDQRPATAWTAAALALRRSVLPQANTLAFPFAVAEVVEMGRAPWARTPASVDDDEAIARAILDCELGDYVDRPFSDLSGGERARVALARVLAQRTALMLLDEPTAAFDLRHQEMTLRLCRERAAEGCGVVIVLHDLTLAAAYCDRVALVADGRLMACGKPSEVFQARLLSDVYRQRIEVIAHPRTGDLLILPDREPSGSSDQAIPRA